MSEEWVPLLERAARCYEQESRWADAARCYAEAGFPQAASRHYERAGELARAAECFERAGDTALAARCLLRLGQPENAAGVWERKGDALTAGWLLITTTRRFRHAHWLVEGARSESRGQRLRRDLAIGLCAALERRQAAHVVEPLESVRREITGLRPPAERRQVLRWAVEAADLVGRFDLAAQVFAAAHRTRDQTVLPLWHEWARASLGGTTGLPPLPADTGAA